MQAYSCLKKPRLASWVVCFSNQRSAPLHENGKVIFSDALLEPVQAFVKELHASKQYWVPIVDPGIKVDPGYPAYDQGLAAHAFINDATGQPFLGQVCMNQM